MKKIATVIAAGALAASMALTGCSAQEPAKEAATTEAVQVEEVAMSYITPADAAANLTSADYVIVDVRKAADYEAAHIPGAIGMDMDAAKEGDNAAGLATVEAAMKANNWTDQKLVLVCYSGKRYAQASTNCLVAAGYDAANILTLEGGMEAWGTENVVASGMTSAGDQPMTQLAPEAAKAELENDQYLFVDVRKAADYEAGHIEGAIAADMDKCNKGGDFQNGCETLGAALVQATGSLTGADKTLVMVCYSGKSYAQAATNVAIALGTDASKIVTLEGGMEAWGK